MLVNIISTVLAIESKIIMLFLRYYHVYWEASWVWIKFCFTYSHHNINDIFAFIIHAFTLAMQCFNIY